MKRILLMLAVMAAHFGSYAQKTDTVLFNGVTKIIIKNKMSASENYKASGQTLLDLNYNTGTKDAEFFQLASEPFKVSAQGAEYMISIYTVSKDNQITITGKAKNLSSFKVVDWQNKETPVQIIPYKKLRQLTKNIYSRLEAFARSIPHETIIYSE